MDVILKPITKAVNALYKALVLYSQLVIFLIVIIIVAQVLSRQVLRSSIPWSEEVSLFLMVWMAFISLAIGVEKRLHIAVTVFFDKFPRIVRKIVETINYILTIAVGVFCTIDGSKLMISTMKSTLPATQWPKGMMYLMIPVGGAFVVYFSLLQWLAPKYLPENSELEVIESEKGETT